MSIPAKLQALAARWASAKAAERSNAQSYLKELCQALEVEEPRPAGTGYEFEYPVKVVSRDGTESTNFVDLYKAGFFALEAKDEERGKSTDMLLRKAFGQVRSYVGHLPHERPPYLMVLDVARTLIVWDRWNGDYGGFNAGRRIELSTLAGRQGDIELLRDVWENPCARDPRSKAVAVTKELAGRLAELAAKLEKQGYEQERVARFLMRCVFTMFAEDVGLLHGEPFRHIIDDVALADPAEFVPLAEDLWHSMDEGKRFMLKKLLRFNGHFFKDAEALPLERDGLALLLTASQADWAHVEPTIFGTLLTRALDPEERHKLGAEYTPREFVERVVRPTVEEPIRERWTLVQAEVLQLREAGKKKDLALAEKRLREFHGWLHSLRFLDPACGSGNFLYVTMHIVKRIELEAIRLLEDLTDSRELRMQEVGPWQFHGIEVKPWAREIAELTLWIGFHQFWKEHHSVQPPEPILQDTGTLECRDAVLSWEGCSRDPSKDRPDPTPRIRSGVTGELVPDPSAVLEYTVYEGARPARWPHADFIVGNPPYLGQARQREAFGDGYVDALRAAYPAVPDTADYVMYWWYRAAQEVAAGRTMRAGLITTNSITQSQNRAVLAAAAEVGVRVRWAIPDHPWVDEANGAAVRVAMTVLVKEPDAAHRIEVDEDGQILRDIEVPRLNADLSAHADVASAAAVPLLANEGLSSPGFKLHGAGFILSHEDAADILESEPSVDAVIRPYRNGRDLAARPRGAYVIDFALMSEEKARAYSVPYQIVSDRVKPERDANKRAAYRNYWWRFGEPRRELRDALTGLSRYIATVETSRHRFFTFLDASIAPDNKLIVIASDDAYHLGVLSSSIHVMWALAAGARLGVGNDPVYVKTRCFDAFPFPDADESARSAIELKAEELDRHRTNALLRDARVTMTGMYNVVAKLRAGAQLSASEQLINTKAACGVLRQLHDELDSLVARAYGWSWPEPVAATLESLVSLHDRRAQEESEGRVRWLRPGYQPPRFGSQAGGDASELPLEAPVTAKEARRGRERQPWPDTVQEQIAAIRSLLSSEALPADAVARRFVGARRDLVAQQLEILAMMGEIDRRDDGCYENHSSASLRYVSEV